jgi:hypothetical protein
MQQTTGLIGTILTILLIAGVILLYVYARTSGLGYRPPLDKTENVTSSEKLRLSKMHDAAFFDGESEDYAEHMSRIRQQGS